MNLPQILAPMLYSVGKVPNPPGEANIQSGHETLYGQFFRIGRINRNLGMNQYGAAMHNKTVQSDSSDSGGMLRMVPPAIPHRNVTVRGIRNGINLQQVTAYGRWGMPPFRNDR